MARWIAVLGFGFVAGAATVLLFNPGDTETRVIAPVNTVSGGHVHAAGASGSAGGHTHAESDISYAELPKKTKTEVDKVIAAFGTKYATAADAVADGWWKSTRNLYG